MPEHRPNTDVCIMAYSFRRLSLRQGLLAVLCFPIVCIFMLGQRLQWSKSFQEPIPNCIGWKATDACLPEGYVPATIAQCASTCCRITSVTSHSCSPRQPHLDKTCNVEVGGGSGYCLCEGNVTVARYISTILTFALLTRCPRQECTVVRGRRESLYKDSLQSGMR